MLHRATKRFGSRTPVPGQRPHIPNGEIKLRVPFAIERGQARARGRQDPGKWAAGLISRLRNCPFRAPCAARRKPPHDAYSVTA
jgi:hypothetical protein